MGGDKGYGHKGTGGGMAMNGKRVTLEDNVINEGCRVRNGGGEDNGMNVKCPVDGIGN